MTKWETCEITRVVLREMEIKGGGFFSTRSIYVPGICQLVAQTTGPSGTQTIYKSAEYQYGSNPLDEKEASKKEDRDANAAYQKMIAHLSREGWEPAATSEGGRVTLMRRQVIEPDTQAATDPTNLLQQLANLRDAGILTEREFQKKKEEVLGRI